MRVSISRDLARLRAFIFDGKGPYILWVFVLRLSLELGYVFFVHPVFASYGFGIDFSGAKYLESWVLYLVLLAVFPARLNRPSDYLMSYMLFGFLLPLLIFYGLANQNRDHLYLVLLGAVSVLVLRHGRPFIFSTVNGGLQLAVTIASIACLVVTVWMIGSGGLRYFNLDFSRVYEFREQSSALLNVGVMNYFNIWATKAFGPFLLAMALWKRKYILVPIIFLLHVFWFSVTAHKGIVFYPFLVLFVWFWFRTTISLTIIAAGMAATVLFSLLAFFAIDDTWLGALTIRRVFFVPSMLTFEYYEFFSQNEPVFWSNSILSSVIEYPYEVGTAKLIGEYLGTNAHANNSFLATGYMHAGAIGIAIYGVIVGFFFRLLDSFANRGVPTWVAVAVMIVPSESLLISSDLPTAFLTHGMGVSALLLFLCRRRGSRKLKFQNKAGCNSLIRVNS